MKFKNTVKFKNIIKQSFLFLILLNILIVLSSSSYALNFLQNNIDISDTYIHEQTIVITLENTNPNTENILLQFDEYSEYLIPYIELNNRKITLSPNEKRNILLKTNFPSDLSPEKHNIVLYASSLTTQANVNTTISFKVNGQASPSYKIDDASFRNEQNSISCNMEIKNTGNIILYISPKIVIEQNGSIVKSIPYKHQFQIMPKKTENIILRQDKYNLEDGNYIFYIELNDPQAGKQITNKIPITIKKGTSSKSIKDESHVYSLFGLTALATIVFFLIHRTKNPLDNLEQREKNISKEIRKLSKETNKFAKSVNAWITKNKLN